MLRSIGLNWLSSRASTGRNRCISYDKFRKQVLRKRWGLDWKKINAAERPGTFNVYNFSKHQLRVVDRHADERGPADCAA